MSVSVSFPKLKIQSEWDPMNYKLRATHEFQDRGKGLDDDFDLDAADENVILGTATGFNSTKPDTGDKIVKASMYGTFGGHGLIYGVNDLFECPGKLPDYEVKERNATAHAFYEYEIDDL
jgi:hypothetical protein